MTEDRWDVTPGKEGDQTALEATPLTGPRTATGNPRVAILNRLNHTSWCEWWTIGECACESGQRLITLLAHERAEAAAQERERIRAALTADGGFRFEPGGVDVWAADTIFAILAEPTHD